MIGNAAPCDTTWFVVAANTIGADPSARDQADALLKQADEAMRNADFTRAEKLISAAEQLNPKYSIFHFGDTPEKARGALRKAMAAEVQRRDTGLPSKRFSPLSSLTES
ncbi:MAG: hypothetical protein KDA42_12425, partial [Planctomycetales bacterium]|nr:hypothetical protein [Planctomycetales bacterium]